MNNSITDLGNGDFQVDPTATLLTRFYSDDHKLHSEVWRGVDNWNDTVYSVRCYGNKKVTEQQFRSQAVAYLMAENWVLQYGEEIHIYKNV